MVGVQGMRKRVAPGDREDAHGKDASTEGGNEAKTLGARCGKLWLSAYPKAVCTREAGHAGEHVTQVALKPEAPDNGKCEINWKDGSGGVDVPKTEKDSARDKAPQSAQILTDHRSQGT